MEESEEGGDGERGRAHLQCWMTHLLLQYCGPLNSTNTATLGQPLLMQSEGSLCYVVENEGITGMCDGRSNDVVLLGNYAVLFIRYCI